MSISVVSLITWICAAGCGLYLVSIWLIEYDKEFQTSARTRLPPAVLAAHVTCAAGGLVAWGVWFVWWTEKLVWAAAVALLLAAGLGTTMAIRWVSVYREYRAIRRGAAQQQAVSQFGATFRSLGAAQEQAMSQPGAAFRPFGAAGQAAGRVPTARQVAMLDRPIPIGPPERNFPLPVVIAHGVFAVATLTMVLLILVGAAH